MANRIIALAFAMMMSTGIVGYTYTTGASPTPMVDASMPLQTPEAIPDPTPEPTPVPTPEPVLETLSADVVSPTHVEIRWGDIGVPYYVLLGSVDGRIVMEELLYTCEAVVPVVPNTAYAFTVCPLGNDANGLTTLVETPEAPRFNRYKTDVYNTYLAYSPDPDVGIYDQKRTGVKSIGLSELFANIEKGYRYFIHMDVLWSKTSEAKVLDNCVLVMRTPDGGAFAFDELSFKMESESERYFFGCLLNDYLAEVQSSGEMILGTYTFEYYVDGMFIGKAAMKIT